MRLPWKFMQIEPDLYAIVDRDDETVMELDWDWDHRHDAVQDLVEMANGLYEAMNAVWSDRGENMMRESLCPLHGPDCGAECIIPTALARARGEAGHRG